MLIGGLSRRRWIQIDGDSAEAVEGDCQTRERRMNHNLPKVFHLLRWYSVASLLALLIVGSATAFILSHYITQDTLRRDAIQTGLFLQNCIEVEGRHAGLKSPLDLAHLLDEGVDPAQFGVSAQQVNNAREEILDHMRSLPDVLLTSLFTRDGRIVWSTNPALVGTMSDDNDELQEAFAANVLVARHHPGNQPERGEQQFLKNPTRFFIEQYFPLRDARGEVALVAEVYKEPSQLQVAIDRGRMWVGGTLLLAGALVYLGLFGVVRRASRLLSEQHQRLVEADALVFVGEMASAIAHGLRNPLASIRTSAELALLTAEMPARKNAEDIITQVDVLSRWIRNLLSFSRPVTGDTEPVDLAATIDSVLDNFGAASTRNGIRLVRPQGLTGLPPIEGNTALVTQALQSLVANAVESMPQGGELRVEAVAVQDGKRVELTVSDTGCGMSAQQQEQAFKPFHTTKRNGVGVGLSTVKRVMDRFGGTVELSSQEHVGTKVRLRFRGVQGGVV